MSDLRIRIRYERHIAGESFQQLDEDFCVRAGDTEAHLRAYTKRRKAKSRMHYGTTCAHSRGYWQETRDKDEVTCLRCIKHLKNIGEWE
jgi:hypothetical protein